MNVGRIYAIALNTYREAARDRVLYGVLVVATAVLAFTLALAQLSLDQEERVIIDLGMATISAFSVLVAIFLGSSLLYKEIERKTLYVVLPKPIHRYEFLLGKYIGIVLTCLVFIAIMGAILFWIVALHAGAKPLPMWGSVVATLVVFGVGGWFTKDVGRALAIASVIAIVASSAVGVGAGIDLEPLWAGLVLNAGEVWILAAVALLFSSFSTPFLTGMFTFGVWMVGRSADDMATMKSSLLSDGIKKALRVLAEVLPNFNLYVPGRQTLVEYAEGFGGAWIYVARAMGYSLTYSIVVLIVAAFIFRRRDFL